MTTDRTSLGDRMKGYEAVTRFVLPRRSYTIMRLDGRAFHSYTRGLDKPFDAQLMSDMATTAAAPLFDFSDGGFLSTQLDLLPKESVVS